MAWDEQRARQRVTNHDFSGLEVNVADLSREMDFHRLGTKDVRRVQGAHLYADVPNFHDAVADARVDAQKLKKLVRAASVLRRAQSDLLRVYEIGSLQLQAARLHCVVYKPYNDEAERAVRAVVLAVSLNSYLYDVFNDVFSDVRDFEGAVGVAAGESLVANLGFRGERELISLGSCANLSAKVINGIDTITITENAYALLPDALREHFEKSRTVAGAVTYRAIDLRWRERPRLAEALGVQFDAERLKKRTEEYRDALPLADMELSEGGMAPRRSDKFFNPLADMELSEAHVLIDLDALSERTSKRTSAVVLYADLDGFTRYVQAAERDEDIVSLVRILHMIRTELHAVVEQDYPGLVLQHQGDRLFAIVPMPPEDRFDKRCANGLAIAIGLQSSMEHVLNTCLQDRKDIHLAVGVDVGTVLVTRLGKKGAREVVCLGPQVISVEGLQLRSAGREIRISKAIYESIDDDTLKRQFVKDNQSAYVAKGLTFPKLDEIEEAEAAQAGMLAAEASTQRLKIEVLGSQRPIYRIIPKPWWSG